MIPKNIRFAFSALVAIFLILTTSACGNATNQARDARSSRTGAETASQGNSAAIIDPVTQFSTPNLTGKWHLWLIENGNPGRGWVYMAININPEGKLTCTNLVSSDGSLACQDVSPLPDISVSPEGFLSISEGSIYGTLDHDGSTAYLEQVDSGVVVKKGVMTRVENNIDMAELSGTWTMLLLDNGNGNSPIYLKIDLAPSGEMTCLDYFSDDGNFTCPPLPTINIDTRGILYSDDNNVMGLLNYDRTSGTMAFQTNGEVFLSGAFTRTSADFVTSDLEGRWTITILGEANLDYIWAILRVAIDELGNPTCLQYFDTSGRTTCPPLGAFSLGSDGIVLIEETLAFGTMDHDRNTAHLVQVSEAGGDFTGVMTRDPSEFDNSDLIGTYSAILTGNGADGFGWAFLEASVDGSGVINCNSYVDSDGILDCPPPTAYSITPEGLLSLDDGSIYGFMSQDRLSFHLIEANSDGVVRTGTLTKKSIEYDIENLTGRWTAFLIGNENSGFGWAYVIMDVNAVGEAACVVFVSSDGTASCADFLLTFAVQPNGLISSLENTVYGVMEYGRDSAKIAVILQGNVSYTGIMTRSFQDDTHISSLSGRWTAFLSGSGSDWFGWAFAELEISPLGQATCLTYIDSLGNVTCPEFPALAIDSNGLITSEYSTLYGILNHGGNSVFLAEVADGITKMSGVLTRR